MELMGRNYFVIFLCILLLFSGVSSVSASSSPARIVNVFVSSSFAKLMKWIWSLQTTTKTAISGRSMVKYEGGYEVETVFDGSKLGIEPYSVEILPDGELLVLDSANSNLYKISSALSLYSRPKLVAGSAEGYSGYVDGKHREAKMNHPKGVAVDDRGNIYVADTVNMAIRKISDTGVTTIAGGKSSHRGGHVDGPSEDAKFSNDFDVVYVGSSCSLLVIDRGNRAIREIQLHFDDCAYQYESSFPLGIAVLVAAGFFGYMLALLQRRVGSIVSSQNDVQIVESFPPSSYQKPLKSVRPPLIPTEDESEKQEESFLLSLKKLLAATGTSTMEIIGSIFPVFRSKPVPYQYQNPMGLYQQSNGPYQHPIDRQSQESFEIPKEEEPPSIDRLPTPKKTYAFMSTDADKMQQQSRVFYSGWDTEVQKQQKHQNRHQHHSSVPNTYFEQSNEKSSEIVFGAVQEEDHHQSVIRPTPYALDSSIQYRNGYASSFSSYT